MRKDQLPDGIVHLKQLINAGAALITGMRALLAALPHINGLHPVAGRAAFPCGHRRLAVRTDQAHQALGQHPQERRRQKIVFNAHFQQPGNGPGRVVGVQRAEHHVAGEGRMHCNFRSFPVPDLPHQNDVRVLAHDVPQAPGEGEADVRLHLHLDDSGHAVFHRVLHGDDLLFHRIDAVQRRI